jgi:hypothetical protein
LVDYFDRKKSQVKAVFLKEIFKRRRWIGHAVFWERCGSAKSDFWRVKAPYLVMEILKSLATESEGKNSSKKIVKSNLDNISHAMKELVKICGANRQEGQKYVCSVSSCFGSTTW